ncbi:MAG: hypothetical protein ACI9OJ_000223 [Myxococcota bacterium]|jgi:hypothetical protein
MKLTFRVAKFALLGLSVASLAMGCGKKDDAAKAGGDKAPAKKVEAKPVEAIKAAPADLYAEYKKDEKATVAKYKGKTLEVEGVVSMMGQDFSKNTFITLVTVKDDMMGMKVVVDAGTAVPWATLAKGQKVKVTGNWPEFSMGPALVDATFEAVGDSVAPDVKAEDFIKEFIADGEKAEAKYEDKPVRVTGKVTAAKMDGAYTATLAAGDGTVNLGIGSMDKWAHAIAVKDAEVTALCQFSSWDDDTKQASLYMCLPVKK